MLVSVSNVVVVLISLWPNSVWTSLRLPGVRRVRWPAVCV